MDAPTPEHELVDPKALAEAFGRRFGRRARVFFAPGRVNLIGAHLDYNGGPVLPLGVGRGTYVAVAPSGDGRCRLASRDLPGEFELDPSGRGEAEALGWAAYPVGVWKEMRSRGYEVGGFDLLVEGDLPRGGGLSSSASLEVATGTALAALFGLELDPVTLAEVGHRAENGFVGVQCGIMDQFASALALEGHALHLDCRTRSWRHVPLGAALEILILDSGKPRELVDSEFNRRVDQCREALGRLRRVRPGPEHLAGFTLAEVEAARAELGDLLFRRARHVVTEVARTELAVRALEAGDLALFGRLVRDSHESSARDYEVSCEELDHLVAKVCEVDGVYGARLTGAGFGGCVVALQRPGALGGEAREDLARTYRETFGRELRILRLEPGKAPRELPLR